MPKVEVDLEIEQLANALKRLTPGELETLEIMLNPKLKGEQRRSFCKL